MTRFLPLALLAWKLLVVRSVERLVVDRQRGRMRVEERLRVMVLLRSARVRDISLEAIREIRFDATVLDAEGGEAPEAVAMGTSVRVSLAGALRHVAFALESGSSAAEATRLALPLARAVGLPWFRQVQRKGHRRTLVLTRDPSGARAVPPASGDGDAHSALASANAGRSHELPFACPGCGARMGGSSLSADLRLARCPSCGAVVDVDRGGEAPAIPAEALMATPEGVEIERSGGRGRDIRLQWRRTRKRFVLPFVLEDRAA